MSSKWYMSSCFNTGLQASRITNDAILSMSISAANSQNGLDIDQHYHARLERAVGLLAEIIERLNQPQMQRLKVWNTADSTTNLAYVLIARSAGDVNSLRLKLDSSKDELTRAVGGRPVFSIQTFNTLKMIEDAAQEVVEENNSSLIDID